MAASFDLDGLDTREIGRLMELLAGGDVEECEIERGEFKLFIRRRARGEHPHPVAAPVPAPAEDLPQEEMVIRASAVGVFTRAERDSPAPKMEVGSRVGVGDVVGYIEVMMIPHAVHSHAQGAVEAFLVEEGEPVEFGQPLVVLRSL